MPSRGDPQRPLLLPVRGWFAAGSGVQVEVRARQPVDGDRLLVHHLGRLERSVDVLGPSVDLTDLPVGGYTVTLVDADGAALAGTAVQVLAEGAERSVLRYGFTADYRADRDLDGLIELARRLHLTAVQLYDWAYRHADLVGGGERYADALDRPIELTTVRRLVERLDEVGAQALGYAAIYAVGEREWSRWSCLALLDAVGEPYSLGDFLTVVDPGDPTWLAHLADDLRRAMVATGLTGFHLDQYGWPKRAALPDGRVLDLADRFVAALTVLRRELPTARLVFNNVNDFPTWATATTGQDAVYIEVWAPHTRLADLAAVVTRARAVGRDKPVVVAAYLSSFAGEAPLAQREQAARLTMATLFSHGATHLLVGEQANLLVDPYYPNNAVAPAGTIDLLARWYDFLVAHHDLLLPADVVEVTGAYAGTYNDDLEVTFAGAPVSGDGAAGTVWRRITRTGHGLVVHLINLVGVTDPLWDAPQPSPGDPGSGSLRLRRVAGTEPRVLVADPDGEGRLLPAEVTVDGTHATARLPALGTWALLLIPD